jgi:threonine/homoserine/homoserine lactone efflux protein
MPMSVAFITGLLMSFIGSMIPTGPIALIVLKRGLGRQKFGALAIVSGAAVAEAGYALIAFLGLNLALSAYPVQTSILRMIAGIILIGFAIFCFYDSHGHKPRNTSPKYAGANFLLGLSIAGLNPTFLVTWAGGVAVARGAGLISGLHAAPAFALGVIVGPVLWFWLLLTILTRHVEYLHPDSLKKIEKALPVVLLILAAVMLWQAFYLLLHHA